MLASPAPRRPAPLAAIAAVAVVVLAVLAVVVASGILAPASAPTPRPGDSPTASSPVTADESIPVPTPPGAAASGSVATPAPGETPAATPSTPAASPPPGSSPTPKPPAARSVKDLPLYVSNGPAKKKWIALTFDADMYPFMYAARNGTPEVDTRIIDLLEKTNTPATFFLNGLWAKAYPDIVKRLAKNPDFQLGNHSWDHADWTTSCADSLSHPISAPMTRTTEVTQTADLIKQLTGVKPQFYRFPGGCHGTADTQLLRKFGETGIGWSCFFGDTMRWTTAQQVASVQNGCGRGSIVVTHINGAPYHPNVYEALKVLIPWWKSHGWTVVTIGTLFNVARPSAGN